MWQIHSSLAIKFHPTCKWSAFISIKQRRVIPAHRHIRVTKPHESLSNFYPLKNNKKEEKWLKCVSFSSSALILINNCRSIEICINNRREPSSEIGYEFPATGILFSFFFFNIPSHGYRSRVQRTHVIVTGYEGSSRRAVKCTRYIFYALRVSDGN